MIFDELAERIQWALTNEKFSVPTSIQEKAIPIILQGRDLIGIAQTGTGKTASFVLPILHLLSTEIKSIEPNSPLVLVLSPTRELAMQIDKTFERFGKHLKIRHTAIFGGVSQEPQIKILSKGIHVLTATPGRLLDLITHGKVNLSSVKYIVLDEAHMMLDMGFLDTVKEIYEQVSKKRQSLFFSATITPEILKLANELLDHPSTVEIKAEKASNLIFQKVCYLYSDKKNALLLELIKETGKTIVFLRTKYKTDDVAKLLIKNNIYAASIHSDKKQDVRIKTIENFKSGKIKVLVATDIAARGIHIDNVSCVINYNTPNYPDVYVNRIGRTARAGKFGVSYTFCSLEERESIRKIEKYTSVPMEVVHHTYYASKIENATDEDIVVSVKKKNPHKYVAKRSKNKSEFYVQPINQKKAKKPRGVHVKKGTKRLKKHNKRRK
jgi:ATP-dependent RNA helicase RhlE